MPERSGTLRAFALGAGALLAIGASAAGGIVAAVGGWLAQPLLALLVRDPRGERPFAWADAFALAQRWAVALLLAGLLLAWPLASLLYKPGLAGVLGLSAVVGLGLVALWYGWTAWHRVETGHAARRARAWWCSTRCSPSPPATSSAAARARASPVPGSAPPSAWPKPRPRLRPLSSACPSQARTG